MLFDPQKQQMDEQRAEAVRDRENATLERETVAHPQPAGRRDGDLMQIAIYQEPKDKRVSHSFVSTTKHYSGHLH